MEKEEHVLQCLEMGEYQARDAYSRSDLMLVKKSPYHLMAKRERLYSDGDKESSAMLIGELVHCIVLETEEVSKRFIGAPNIDRRTKAGKQMWADFVIEAQDRILVDQKTFDIASCMAMNVLEQEISSSALKGCVIERSILWHDNESGLDFKCRPDAYNPANGIVVDLKTTKDASYRGMQGSSVRYGYFLQAAMIRAALEHHGLKFSKYVLLCVENTEPYVCAPFIIDDSALDSGLAEFSFLKRKLATCLHENKFEHHPLKTLLYPSWAEQEFED